MDQNLCLGSKNSDLDNHMVIDVLTKDNSVVQTPDVLFNTHCLLTLDDK